MKRNLLKAIGISFLIFVVLSWIIPVGSYYGGKFTNDGIDAVGLFDLIGVPVQTMLTFALYAAVFACIGGLYGVISKTGTLELWTDKIAKRFTGKEKRFIIFTIIFFVVLSSLTGLVLPLFVLVPLFAVVFTKLNYDKVTAFASTIGSLLVGSVCSTYGFNITGYTKNLLSLDMNSEIWAKVILLVLLTALLIFFVLKYATKKEIKVVKETKEAKEEKTAKVVEEEPKKKATKVASKVTTSKKKATKKKTQNMAVAKDVKKVNAVKTVSIVPLVVIVILMMIITLVGMYNWYYSFGIELFNDIHATVMGVKIGDFPIFEHLLSGISQFGYWGNTEFIMMMVIASALIAFVYRLKFGQYVESFIAGMKKMMPTALYAALASIILSVLYPAVSQGAGTMVTTMFNSTLGNDFNVFTTGLTALYGSFFYNDLYYLLYGMQAFMSNFDANALNIAGLLIQSVYALGMLIFPTSVVLIAGLSYFDVSYKKWIKYIWKFALIALIIVFATCLILTVI
ncbi:MAG: hypothetical protein IJ093_00685 [Bacilli bacterium]|nr:hypothetical protein [Bacilli bacterium]